jgi:D-amino peptidase
VTRRVLSPLFLLLILLAPIGESGAQPRKLKLHISVDMEGIAGVVSDQQLGPEGFEYARFREFMTAEALAAVDAAFSAGATEVVVADSHGNGQNLLIEKFPKAVTVVRSWPRPLEMMQGIDSTFDGALFIGYHASTTNPMGVRAHTISSARFADVRINGVSMSEASLNAMVAGHFGVPVLMISGDDAAAAEAQKQIGPIEGAVVKYAISFHSARTLTPEAAQDLIREKVRRAVARVSELKPLKATAPIRLEVQFKNYRPAQLLAYLPIVEQADAHTIRFTAKDMVEVSRFMAFLTNFDEPQVP